MLKLCPICNKKMSSDDIRIYGIYWRDEEKEDFRIYTHGKDVKESDNPCWKLECYEYKGGCGSYITADDKESVIEKWNKRTER